MAISPSSARRRAQLDILQPGERVDTDPVARLRMDQGNEFEADLFAEIQAGPKATDWVFIERDAWREAIDLTLAVMDRGSPVIAGGWLRLDLAGRPAGRPEAAKYQDIPIE